MPTHQVSAVRGRLGGSCDRTGLAIPCDMDVGVTGDSGQGARWCRQGLPEGGMITPARVASDQLSSDRRPATRDQQPGGQCDQVRLQRRRAPGARARARGDHHRRRRAWCPAEPAGQRTRPGNSRHVRRPSLANSSSPPAPTASAPRNSPACCARGARTGQLGTADAGGLAPARRSLLSAGERGNRWQRRQAGHAHAPLPASIRTELSRLSRARRRNSLAMPPPRLSAVRKRFAHPFH